jgi:hypothetical protein
MHSAVDGASEELSMIDILVYGATVLVAMAVLLTLRRRR